MISGAPRAKQRSMNPYPGAVTEFLIEILPFMLWFEVQDPTSSTIFVAIDSEVQKIIQATTKSHKPDHDPAISLS